MLYLDQKDTFEALTDEEAGKLIKAIFKYEYNGEEEELDRILKMAFIPIKNCLDRNREKYDNKCEVNKANGAKGGRPKKPKKTSRFFENRSKPNKSEKSR